MARILDTLYVNNPYQGADLSDVDADMQGWGWNHFLFRGIMEIVAPKTIIEVGTWKGMSAMHMADIGKEMGIEGLEICCIDTWLGSPGLWNSAEFAQDMLKLKNGWPMLYFTFMKNVLERKHDDVITPLPMPADMAHFVLAKKGVLGDMIYVDAAHDYENCKRDLQRYWELLASDGVLLGDDYDDKHPGVVEAAHEFAEETGIDIVTTRGKFVLSKDQNRLLRVKDLIREVDERRARVEEQRRKQASAQ